MKKLLVLAFILSCLSCESNDSPDFCDIINPTTVNLVNPQFINLLSPAGWSYAPGGPKGLIMYNTGSSFKAFSRECPQLNGCTQRLEVKNDIKMVCPCDDSEYSILDGSPQTENVSVSVCEFKVSQAGSDVLTVSNF